MADLNDLNSAQTVKIVGTDFTGVEQTPVKSTSNGDLAVTDIISSDGVENSMIVGITAIEAKAGEFRLANRKSLTVFNNSSGIIYWGYNNSVTTSTGTPIFKKQIFTWAIGDKAIYLIADTEINETRITEGG